MMSILEEKRITLAGLQAFFNLGQRWGLDASQERALLGNPLNTLFIKWKTEKIDDGLDTDYESMI